MTTGEVLAGQLRRTREWTLLLLDGLNGDDWMFQAKPGMQHALWLCGHFAGAQELLVFQRCLNTSVLDPDFRAHFAIGADVKSATEHDWPSPSLVLQKMAEMQAATEKAVAGMDDAFLAEPAMGKDGTRHPHYDNKLEAISHLARHEAFHAGQLAMIRRLVGKSFLR